MLNLPLPILDGTTAAHFDVPLRAASRITTLQINIGYLCNLACFHCHVESSPARTASSENMDAATARRVVTWTLAQEGLDTVDFTGGSPEMNANFCWMVETFRDAGLHVIDRCNPTIITYADRENGTSYEWIPEFLARHQVEVVASMPCYLEQNVDRQRGRNAYSRSVEGLRRLNDVGYGRDPALVLNLVYNPNGPHLPPPQDALEGDYRHALRERFGLEFNNLWTITNMPIRRWRHQLKREGRLESYMTMLVNAFNPGIIEGLMCRHQINIDPRGRLFDCDFNQAIDLPMPGTRDRFVWDFALDELAQRAIATDDHCYGCTAGSGSSCGGALA